MEENKVTGFQLASESQEDIVSWGDSSKPATSWQTFDGFIKGISLYIEDTSTGIRNIVGQGFKLGDPC